MGSRRSKKIKAIKRILKKRRKIMNILFIITTDDAEKVYNAVRLANTAVNKGDRVSIFMLGKGVCFEQISSEQFDIKSEIDKFKGDMYV